MDNLQDHVHDVIKASGVPLFGLLPQYLRRTFRVWAENGYVNVGKKKSSVFG